MRILVAGCGYVGSALARRLIADSHQVYVLRRSPAQVVESATTIACDLTDPDALMDLPDVDAVAYTASADDRSETAYREAYVDGLKNIIHAVQPGRLVFTSSTAVYGQNDGSWVDETSPTHPTRFTGEVMLQAEAIALEAGGIALRLGGIYGPTRDRLIRRVRSGEATLSRGAPHYTNRIHRDDCAGAAAHLLLGDSRSEVVIGVDDAPAARDEVLGWLADQLGTDLRSDDSAMEAPATGKRCRNARLKASGYALSVPTFRHGYGAMLAATPPRAAD